MEYLLNILLNIAVGTIGLASILMVTLLCLHIYDKTVDMITEFLYYVKENHPKIYRFFTQFTTTITILIFAILVICSV